MSMQSPVPSFDKLAAALELLAVPTSTIQSFCGKTHDNIAWEFTQALCESPQAIVTDWKFHPSDALREIFLRLYPVGVKAMIETENAETLFPSKIFLQSDGIGSRYSAKIPKNPDLHEIVFAFRAILPDKVRIFALTTFDGSDTYGHVVAAKEIWLQLSQLLGPWFAEVFREQAAKPMFKKVGKDVKPKRDFVKKNIKELRTWLERIKTTFDGRYTEMLDVLNKRLESPFLMEHPGLSTIAREHREKKQREWHDFVTSSRRLLLLNGSQWGGRAGAEGLLDFWDKKPNGWSKLRLALEYFYWDVPIELRFKEARHQFFGCGDFGNKLALAIALGEWPTADYFCKQMLRVENFRVADSSLSRFLLKLYSLRNPAIFDSVPEPEKSYGVYGSVFAAWNDPLKLAGALDVACDYHIMRTGDDYEFSWSPFQTFAAEILAVVRIRQELGLETRPVEHQLLDAPWREVPKNVPLETDTLLERLQQVAHHEVPDMLTRT